jgi:hypothetical protein
MQVSLPYAAFIRSGRRSPHPRHWPALAELLGIAFEESDNLAVDSSTT